MNTFKTAMLAAMALLPLAASADNYRYTETYTFDKGDDNFSMDKGSCKSVNNGIIELADSVITIDHVSHPLKHKRNKKPYKSKGCSFAFRYKQQQLKAVVMYRGDRTTYYFIDGQSSDQ